MQIIYFHLLNRRNAHATYKMVLPFYRSTCSGTSVTMDSVHIPSIKAASIWYITFICPLHRAFYSSVPSTAWWDTCTEYVISLLCVGHVVLTVDMKHKTSLNLLSSWYIVAVIVCIYKLVCLCPFYYESRSLLHISSAVHCCQ